MAGVPFFQFRPRWKEELVVSGPEGSFVLELPMGNLSAYLPSEDEWARRAPDWAKPHWRQLNDELQRWCRENGAMFVIESDADVYPC